MRHYSGQAFSDAAKPGAGAIVTVNIAGTNTKAILYSDDGITTKSNPFSSDGLGRYDFYAASGKYDIVIVGAGITPYTIAAETIFDPFETSGADTTQSLKGTFSGSPNPASTGAVRLASPNAIDFRNNANSADVNGLSKNASDVAVLGGAAGVQTNGPLTVPRGSVLSADQVLPLNSLGQGGFWSVNVFMPSYNSGFFGAGANVATVYQFFLPFRAQIGKVSCQVTTGVAGSTGDLGIYDINGNRLTYTGGFSTASNGAFSTPLANVVTLAAGLYYFAVTNTSGATFGAVLNVATAGQALTSPSTIWGTAANPANNGALPATLGSISKNTTVPPILAYFER